MPALLLSVLAAGATASRSTSLRSSVKAVEAEFMSLLPSESDSTTVLQTVHEWGTYISCQGSDGKTLSGVHHEEQALPQFVHTRADTLATDFETNGLDWAPIAGTASEVTQKMETPVIYFYSDSDVDVPVQVNVSFPHGVTSHLYPDAAINLPAIGQVTSTEGGFTSWDVNVKAAGTSVNVPEVDSDNIWAPSRRVDANFVVSTNAQSEAEADRLIFYRGVGKFDLDIQVTSDADTVSVHNMDTSTTVPAAFIMKTDGHSYGSLVPLGPVAPGSAATNTLAGDSANRRLGADVLDYADFESRATVLLEEALRDAGLFPLEARAMVDTWTHSYFKTAGTRVLYVAPREWVDEVLPISVSPQPQNLERVFVGRVEVALASQEQQMYDGLAMGKYTLREAETEFGRFAEPWVRRLAAVAQEHGNDALAATFLARADEIA